MAPRTLRERATLVAGRIARHFGFELLHRDDVTSVLEGYRVVVAMGIAMYEALARIAALDPEGALEVARDLARRAVNDADRSIEDYARENRDPM